MFIVCNCIRLTNLPLFCSLTQNGCVMSNRHKHIPQFNIVIFMWFCVTVLHSDIHLTLFAYSHTLLSRARPDDRVDSRLPFFFCFDFFFRSFYFFIARQSNRVSHNVYEVDHWAEWEKFAFFVCVRIKIESIERIVIWIQLSVVICNVATVFFGLSTRRTKVHSGSHIAFWLRVSGTIWDGFLSRLFIRAICATILSFDMPAMSSFIFFVLILRFRSIILVNCQRPKRFCFGQSAKMARKLKLIDFDMKTCARKERFINLVHQQVNYSKLLGLFNEPDRPKIQSSRIPSHNVIIMIIFWLIFECFRYLFAAVGGGISAGSVAFNKCPIVCYQRATFFTNLSGICFYQTRITMDFRFRLFCSL